MCNQDKCVCDDWHYGYACEDICKNNCSGRGVCQEDDQGHGFCECHTGYGGDDCSEEIPCPNDCSKNGKCVRGECVCDNGYGKYFNNGFEDMRPVAGSQNDCSEKLCLNDCSGKGTCEEGKCMCRSGYSGEDCSFKKCANDCSEHGVCSQPAGVCQCFPGFVGDDCGEEECPNSCSGHGVCDSGCCACSEGYTGVDCSLKECPKDCSGRGSCDFINGVCSCFQPFFGDACEKMLPPRDVVAPTEEVKDEEPIPSTYVEPFAVFTRLRLGIECNTSESWTQNNGEAIKRVMGSLVGVSTEDVEIMLVECTAPTSTSTHLIHIQKTAEPILPETELVLRVISVSEEGSESIRGKMVTIFESGNFLAQLTNEGIEISSLKVLADPILVSPEEEFVYTPKPAVVKKEEKDKPQPPPVVYQPAPSATKEPEIPEEPPLPPGTSEAEVRSAIEFELVLDAPYTTPWEWRPKNEVNFKGVIAEIINIKDGLHRIKVVKISRGSIGNNDRAVKIGFVVIPPTELNSAENAMQEKMKVEEAASDGSLRQKLLDAGVETGSDLSLLKADVATKTSLDITMRCKRCRNGREQSEKDHREFTRKCNRDGSCKRQTPFSIQDACARGCADHCSQTCKRFHDPKARTCAIRRRQQENPPAVANSLTPDHNQAESALVVTNLIEISRDMRQWIRSSVDEQSLLHIGDVQDSSEVNVISKCFAECAESCVGTCIGQWTDTVPDPNTTEAALDKIKAIEQSMLAAN